MRSSLVRVYLGICQVQFFLEIAFVKVSSYIGIIGNKATDRTANEAQNLPDLHTTKLPHSCAQ